ncbi:MAG TPA: hypothetical protein DCL41_06125 [Bdellovibrionales bacterium]|nr:hypothetical protein [Pseudobdellovibrionaceae bacterium]HAG91426.1 hypothetical protein [Bdellovibrionales bacterium]
MDVNTHKNSQRAFLVSEGDGDPLLSEQVEAGLRGDFKRGKEISQILEKKYPQNNRAAFNRAWYKMRDGDLLEGLKLLDHGRWLSVFGDQPLPTSKPIYQKGNPLKGKSVLVCSEGGLGDEIINARFVQDFAKQGAKVVLTCDPSLTSVFSRIEGVSAVIGHRRSPEVYHDYWVPAMSAARVLEYTNRKLTGEPYLKVHPDYEEKWRKAFKKLKGPKIGVRFYGNPKFEHEQFRKFPKSLLWKAVEGFEAVNLQKEETDLDLSSWEDTLGVISQLDLVITSCTSVAHASAALGKATWVVTPILPYYIWALPGETSPWYQSVKLYRQTKFGFWEDVFEKIKLDLKSYF